MAKNTSNKKVTVKDIKLSPKLVELCKSDLIGTVNKMLDSGDTPLKVFNFVASQGFKISRPLIYDYAKIRKQVRVNNINIENLIGVARKPIEVEKTADFMNTQGKLKSELDVLDTIIDAGYKRLTDIIATSGDTPISLSTVMTAISLKNKLTDGAHGFLTEYGMKQLRELEKNKYELLMETLLSYIPEEKKQQAIQELETVEDKYYQETEYYEEYLRAKGLTDEEINKRLFELQQRENKKKVQIDAVNIKF